MEEESTRDESVIYMQKKEKRGDEKRAKERK